MKKILSAIALVLAALGAQAQNAYPLFQPSNGIMVGNTNTYITTSATSSNVISLWSGTCNATTFFRADGSCQTVTTAPGGANTQVQFNNSGVFGGDAGLTYNAATDTLSMGSATITTAATVNGQNVCVANGTNCAVTGVANPSGTIGLTAVNGAATTAMRSDAAPALSQTIAPTWTAQHIFSLAASATLGTPAILLSSGTPAVVWNETDAAANNRAWYAAAGSEAFFMGVRDDAASAAVDFLQVQRTLNVVDSIALLATAVTVNGQNVCRADGTGCPATTGSFTGALTGFAADQNVSMKWRKEAGIVHLWLSSNDITATSTTTAMTMTGIPPAIQGTIGGVAPSSAVVLFINNSVLAPGVAILSGSTLTFQIQKSAGSGSPPTFQISGFTASGAKGLPGGWSITYAIN